MADVITAFREQGEDIAKAIAINMDMWPNVAASAASATSPAPPAVGSPASGFGFGAPPAPAVPAVPSLSGFGLQRNDSVVMKVRTRVMPCARRTLGDDCAL